MVSRFEVFTGVKVIAVEEEWLVVLEFQSLFEKEKKKSISILNMGFIFFGMAEGLA